MTEGPIGPALRRLAVPMGIGIIFIVTLNLVDSYFVGQLGTVELAAMSFTFPVVTLVVSVAMGIGIGTTAVVSRAIGANDDATVRRLTTHALLLSASVVGAISLIGLTCQRPVFSLLGAPDEILPPLVEYMTIWFAGVVVLVVPMVANGVLRASGEANAPMYMMGAAALINGLLDPVLIFGAGFVPALGLAGAAYATLIARCVTLVLALWLLARRQLIAWRVSNARVLLADWRALLGIGLPAAITNALTPIAAGVMTTLVAQQGTAAVAGYGVGSRLEGLLLVAPFALTAALTPFIGQNWGAFRRDRVAEGLRACLRFVLVWGTAAWLFLLVVREPIAAMFSNDTDVVQAASRYLLIVPISYGAAGVVAVTSAAFNAVDRAVRSTLLSATRSLGLAVPAAWVGSQAAGIDGLFAGIGLATMITGILAWRWLGVLTHPHVPTAHGGAVQAFIDSSRPAVQPYLHDLFGRVEHLAEVDVRPRPIATIGFYEHDHELGHIHRDGHLDLHVPPSIVDELVAIGLAEHHRHRPDGTWITRRVHAASDAPRAAQLVHLAAILANACRCSDRETASAIDTLDLPPSLLAVTRAFVQSHRQAVG